MKNKETNFEKKLTQYQILSWPDGDRPLYKCQKTLNKLVNILIDSLKSDELSIVHCSAGVGRTGTFIAMAQLKMLI